MSPIDHINRSITDALSNNSKARGKADADKASSSNTPAPRPAEDKVSISQETLNVRELQQQLDQVPEVDAEKVKAIKQAIAQGDYPLDPKKIAANLMNLEKILSDNA
jgi:negative regulator of flagellin synthesis FlgM